MCQAFVLVVTLSGNDCQLFLLYEKKHHLEEVQVVPFIYPFYVGLFVVLFVACYY